MTMHRITPVLIAPQKLHYNTGPLRLEFEHAVRSLTVGAEHLIDMPPLPHGHGRAYASPAYKARNNIRGVVKNAIKTVRAEPAHRGKTFSTLTRREHNQPDQYGVRRTK